MAIESAYYDTCVFKESFNPKHGEHAACKLLADPAKIKWVVSLCAELSSAEATIAEYLTYFQVECARGGVELRVVKLADAKKSAKPHRHLRKRLFAMGFSQNDWNHLMAALASGVRFLCSVDPDYWDPANKAKRGARRVGTRAKVEIENSLPLKVRLPSELETMI